MKLVLSSLFMVVTCQYYNIVEYAEPTVAGNFIGPRSNDDFNENSCPTVIVDYTRPRVTDIVFLSVDIDGYSIDGKIGIGLFGEICPKTVKNFKELARRPAGKGYKGSKFHRVIKGFMIQGGDFTKRDGTGGQSIYGDRFADENFKINHYGAGWLSMANSGRDSNGSQFFITLAPTPWLDGSHVVFGKVVTGMGYVRMIEEVDVDENNHPIGDVVITNIGSVPISEPYQVDTTDAIE